MTASKENVVIQAGDCRLTLMPALGGKIASIRVGPTELLQSPLHPYAVRSETMGFAEGDASCWDECLPSVAQCTVDLKAEPATIPDHGDLWRVPWQVLDASSDSATLRATCFSLPLQITRTMILKETASGWRLQILYSLINLGTTPVPWAWTAHPLFLSEPGDRIVLPSEVQTLRLEGSGANRLGANGDVVRWPHAHLADGKETDLSVAQPAESGYGDKLFTGAMTEGWCALERYSAGLRIKVLFDPAITPYIGLWLCYGGWPEEAGLKQVCVALEPSTTPVDSLAETGSWSLSIAPGETFNWPMELEIDPIQPDQNISQPL